MARTLNFLKTKSSLTDEEINVIMAARKSLLFNNNQPWEKISGLFDVTMGSFDGAELCEAVGLYLLHLLAAHKIEAGLYRDDGLILSYKSPRTNEKDKKPFVEFSKNKGLESQLTPTWTR